MKEEEFNLSEKRKELLKYLEEQFGENSIIPDDILRYVTEQDKEFVRLLKEAHKDWEDCKYSPTTQFSEIIDKLTGEKLK